MPLNSSLVGHRLPQRTGDIDPRWTMAYAAGVGDHLACYMNTATGPVLAHPMFPVCFEWPLVLAMGQALRDKGLAYEEAIRGVHATHVLAIHKPIKAPCRLSTIATIAAIEQRKPGAYMTMRFDSIDSDGAAICTTWMGTLYRGVAVEGTNRPCESLPPPIADTEGEVAKYPIPISAVAAHVYTECARIWNPIHTDAAAAKRAGLPAIILHGTASLALSVSRIVSEYAAGDSSRVTQIQGRFGAMVLMPSTAKLRITSQGVVSGQHRIHFEMLNEQGARAIQCGCVALS